MSRPNYVIGIVGANGTGKSTITKELIDIWTQSRYQLGLKAQIYKNTVYGSRITFDPQFQFGQYSDYFIKIDPNWAKEIDLRVRDSLITLDDYRILVKNPTASGELRDLFINRKYQNNDYIYSCHAPANIIRELDYFTTHYYIFFTMSVASRFEEKMDDAKLCIDANNMVNKYVSMKGIGKHPLDPEFNGQCFPYVIVNRLTGTLDSVNMDQSLF